MATIATWRQIMQMVGVRELKDHLTQYLSMIKRGENVIVTDRGNPIAIIHSLEHTEVTATSEEKLASLSKRGMIKLPSGRKKLDLKTKAVNIKGKPLSEIVFEDRR